MGFDGLGPLEYPGRVVHVPDSDVGALQRKPHALFCGSQCLNGLIPGGDVGAGAEGADDVPRVIVLHGVAPFDQRVPRPTW